MHAIVDKHELVLESPAPIIKVNELTDSSVNVVCRPWLKTENYLDVYWDITGQEKKAFGDQGVSITFPQHDVHIHQSPGLVKIINPVRALNFNNKQVNNACLFYPSSNLIPKVLSA